MASKSDTIAPCGIRQGLLDALDKLARSRGLRAASDILSGKIREPQAPDWTPWWVQ